MAITLDGTDGVTTTGLTSNGIDDNATSTAITIDASQNVGIGTATITDFSGKVLQIHASSGSAARIKLTTATSGTTTSDGGSITFDTSNNLNILNRESGVLTFGTAALERMRLDSSGNVLVGTTSTSGVQLATSGGLVTNGYEKFWLSRSVGGGSTMNVGRTSTAGTGTLVEWTYNGGVKGTISTNGSSTSYNTTSDYRLKENVVTLDNATDRLKQIPVHRFNFLADADTTVDGFLAHEVQAIVPEAITGTKDEVDDEGNPVYQGIDQSKLVPLLVATVKELEARIATLEAN